MCTTKKVNMVNMDDSEYSTADREYKDRLFRLVFNNREDLLSLYNAVAGAQYEDPEELEINTLGNVLYLSMKNDISFFVSGTLNLYEHQSTTYNPNMPMRGVLYFARLYGKIIARDNINIYSSSPKKFPLPQHIVFYNGTRDQPDRTVLRLSDLESIVTQAFSGVSLGILVPFIIGAIFRTAIGSGTVGMITAASMLLPLVDVLGFNTPIGLVIAMLACASGGFMVFHGNDDYFWVITSTSGMKPEVAYKIFPLISILQAITSFACVFVLYLIFL